MAYKHMWLPGTISTAQLESLYGITTEKCPFCSNPFNVIEPRGKSGAQVVCTSCGAEGPLVRFAPDESDIGKRQAVLSWNTRL